MAVLPGLTLLMGLTDLLSFNLVGVNVPEVKIASRKPGVRILDYPYQVSLRIRDVHSCSGSIISDDSILTAAHCVFNVSVHELSVRVGSSKHFEGELFPVRSVAVHQAYNYSNFDFDVAFVRLNRRLEYGPRVQPIELSEELPATESPVVVTGWDVNLSRWGVLQAKAMRTMDKDRCRVLYPDKVLTSRMICAGNSDFEADSCFSDAGSPLVDLATRKQVGVLSWQGCSRMGLSAVFASVPDLIHSKEV